MAKLKEQSEEHYNKDYEQKEIYQQAGIWESQYHIMLQEARECKSRYCLYEILIEERELELLLREIEKHSVDIFMYGEALVKAYPEEVQKICVRQIRESCEVACDRRQYKTVCKLIVQLITWDGKIQAKNLIEELKERYPRRSALLEELGKIRFQ